MPLTIRNPVTTSRPSFFVAKRQAGSASSCESIYRGRIRTVRPATFATRGRGYYPTLVRYRRRLPHRTLLSAAIHKGSDGSEFPRRSNDGRSPSPDATSGRFQSAPTTGRSLGGCPVLAQEPCGLTRSGPDRPSLPFTRDFSPGVPTRYDRLSFDPLPSHRSVASLCSHGSLQYRRVNQRRALLRVVPYRARRVRDRAEDRHRLFPRPSPQRWSRLSLRRPARRP